MQAPQALHYRHIPHRKNGIFRRLELSPGRRRLTTTEDDPHAHTTLAGRMMHTPLSFFFQIQSLSWLAAMSARLVQRRCWFGPTALFQKRTKLVYFFPEISLLFTSNCFSSLLLLLRRKHLCFV